MIEILDVPLGAGGSRDGCALAPRALREAGLLGTVRGLGHGCLDLGAIDATPAVSLVHPNPAIRNLAEVSAWTRAIADAAYAASADGRPIFLGGDHSISAGTIAGLARRAAVSGRPLFVLWIDAHPDFHTLATTTSGNLHGVPLAYVAGLPGFAPWFPALPYAVEPSHICTLGTRSIDPAEHAALARSEVTVHTMGSIATTGLASPVTAFLDRVAAAEGLLHVSFDVDVLDPSIAPGVGTAVPGGASLAEAQALMAILYESDLMSSLDLVELNPLLDPDGRTAATIVDLVGRLLGRSARDRRRA